MIRTKIYWIAESSSLDEEIFCLDCYVAFKVMFPILPTIGDVVDITSFCLNTNIEVYNDDDEDNIIQLDMDYRKKHFQGFEHFFCVKDLRWRSDSLGTYAQIYLDQIPSKHSIKKEVGERE